jgi:hypothetical protein
MKTCDVIVVHLQTVIGDICLQISFENPAEAFPARSDGRGSASQVAAFCQIAVPGIHVVELFKDEEPAESLDAGDRTLVDLTGDQRLSTFQ